MKTKTNGINRDVSWATAIMAGAAVVAAALVFVAAFFSVVPVHRSFTMSPEPELSLFNETIFGTCVNSTLPDKPVGVTFTATSPVDLPFSYSVTRTVITTNFTYTIGGDGLTNDTSATLVIAGDGASFQFCVYDYGPAAFVVTETYLYL